MDLSAASISNTMSKGSVDEEMSLLRASLEDARSRLAEGTKAEAISNEAIHNGDDILDTYHVTSPAIHGGMGSVWRVHHQHWDIDLAMKRPQPKYFAEGSQSRKEKFIAECENWISLGLHPNIVSCCYVRDIGGVPSIFSEWMDGGSLKDRILDQSLYQGTETQVQERILDIAIQSARGLKYAHNRKLIHLDVKPGNLLLTNDWEVKVADFGLASAQTHLTEGDVPASGGYTMQYSPREQVNGATPAAWMDVYAWALTVLEMYAGERFWDTGADAFRVIFEKAGKHTWRADPPERLMQVLRESFGENGSCGSFGDEDEACFATVEAVDAGSGSRVDRVDFGQMEKVLEEIWLELAGYAYPRELTQTALDTADSLNNIALSYLDLGMDTQARAYWQKALAVNPVHLESAVNEGLWLWRNGKISEREMADRVWYFGRDHLIHNEREYARYEEIRDAFWLEADGRKAAARLPGNEATMPYQISRPVPYAVRIEEDLRRDRCRSEFDQALSEENFSGMLSAYDRLWQLPLTGNNSAQAEMNNALTKLCRLSGIYNLSQNIEVRIDGHASEDPHPTGLYGILPLTSAGDEKDSLQLTAAGDEESNFPGSGIPEEAERSSAGASLIAGKKLPAGGAYRDDLDILCWYYPWDPEGTGAKTVIKADVWDKRDQTLHERLIRYDIGDKAIRRVVAVSSQGHFLILELEPPEGNPDQGSSEDSFELICGSTNGMWQAELMAGYNNPSVEAAFLEDRRYGPNRGFVWIRNTRHLVYFEQEDDGFYLNKDPLHWGNNPEYLPQSWEYDPEDPHARGMEDIFPEDMDNPSHLQRVIESIIFSVNGKDMAMILNEAYSREEIIRNQCGKLLLIWRMEAGRWDSYALGHADRILLTRDLSYMLVGERAGMEKSYWSWKMYVTDLEMFTADAGTRQTAAGQKPLWEMLEFSSTSHINSFSYDLCNLLDENSRPVHAVCWRYQNGRQGNEPAKEKIGW